MTEPDPNGPPKPEGNGERDNLGRFTAGNTFGLLGGRPKGTDFRALVRQARGDVLEQRLLAVFDALATKAAKGDVQAARLLLDKLCDFDVMQADASGHINMSEDERASRVVQLLAVAERRRREAEESAGDTGAEE